MRKEPYTERGIGRMTCEVAGCQNKARFQWNCCTLKNHWIPVCETHDVALNEAALSVLGHPDKDALIERYRNEISKS
jgi:hypothetical protein